MVKLKYMPNKTGANVSGWVWTQEQLNLLEAEMARMISEEMLFIIKYAKNPDGSNVVTTEPPTKEDAIGIVYAVDFNAKTMECGFFNGFDITSDHMVGTSVHATIGENNEIKFETLVGMHIITPEEILLETKEFNNDK